MSQDSYLFKPDGYFGTLRSELVAEVPINSGVVLEVGCGEGVTGAALRSEGRAKSVVGIELFESAAARASKVLDRVIVGDIEQIDLPFEAGQFDAIILGDVLEHLKDPWKQLRRLRSYLSPNGLMIVSLPNVRHWRVSLRLLLLGKWDYQESGILDKTHLRFFTRSSMRRLFADCELNVKKILPVGGHRKILSRVPLGIVSELVTYQYVIVAAANKQIKPAEFNSTVPKL